MKAFPDEMIPMIGATQLVHAFSNHGFKICVCSSASTSAIHLGLQKLGIKDCISIIISGDDVTFGKPHPEPYFLTINAAGVRAEETLAFEDSRPGLKSATSAGIPTILVNKKMLDGHKTNAVLVSPSLIDLSIVKN